jgi:hypothetical protein
VKKQKNKKQKPKKRNILFNILLGIGILAVVVIIGVLIYNALHKKVEELPVEEEVSEYAGEPTKPNVEYGDPESDTYNFTGEYFDRAGENTSMSIIRGDEEGTYSISIFSQEDDYTSYSWEMDATYDSDCKALLYEDGTYYRYLTNPSDPDADPEVFTLSEEATGKIFLHNDALVWLDDIDDKGSGMLFTIRTAE